MHPQPQPPDTPGLTLALPQEHLLEAGLAGDLSVFCLQDDRTSASEWGQRDLCFRTLWAELC